MTHKVSLDKVEVRWHDRIGTGDNAYNVFSIRVSALVDGSQVYVVRLGLYPDMSLEKIVRELEQKGVEAASPPTDPSLIDDEKYLPF